MKIGGRKIVTNFDINKENLCLVEKDILGLHRPALRILTKLNSVSDDTKKLNNLFGDSIDMQRFELCVGTEANFENLLKVKIACLQHCMDSTFSEKKGKKIFPDWLDDWRRLANR